MRLCSDRCDHTRCIRSELRKAHEVMRDLQLSFRRIDLRFGSLPPFLCLVKDRARRPSLPQQRFLALKAVAGFRQLRLRGG